MDNTPAFSCCNEFHHQEGMSLRDYFAAKAMQSIVAKSPFLSDPQEFSVYEKSAIVAYDYADAMMKARNGETTS